MAVKTVGQFSYDDEGGIISGPRSYMDEWGNARLERILAGNDVVFNMGRQYQPDVVTLILVTLQTDYAGWRGQKQMESWLSK